MQKKKIVLTLLASTMVVGTIIGLASMSYASDADISDEDNQESMEQGKAKGGMFTQGLEEYIDVENLSGDDLTLYQTALETFQESMKEVKSLSGDETSMEETMSASWTTFMEAIRELVSEDQLDAFDEFISAGFQFPTKEEGNFGSGDHAKMGSGSKPDFGSGDHAKMGSGNKQDFGSGSRPSFGSGDDEAPKGEGSEKKSLKDFKYITGDTYTQVEEMFGKLTQTKLGKVSQKIDKAINSLDESSSLYDMKLEIYNELKQIIEEMIVE